MLQPPTKSFLFLISLLIGVLASCSNYEPSSELADYQQAGAYYYYPKQILDKVNTFENYPRRDYYHDLSILGFFSLESNTFYIGFPISIPLGENDKFAFSAKVENEWLEKSIPWNDRVTVDQLNLDFPDYQLEDIDNHDYYLVDIGQDKNWLQHIVFNANEKGPFEVIASVNVTQNDSTVFYESLEWPNLANAKLSYECFQSNADESNEFPSFNYEQNFRTYYENNYDEEWDENPTDWMVVMTRLIQFWFFGGIGFWIVSSILILKKRQVLKSSGNNIELRLASKFLYNFTYVIIPILVTIIGVLFIADIWAPGGYVFLIGVYLWVLARITKKAEVVLTDSEIIKLYALWPSVSIKYGDIEEVEFVSDLEKVRNAYVKRNHLIQTLNVKSENSAMDFANTQVSKVPQALKILSEKIDQDKIKIVDKTNGETSGWKETDLDFEF